MKIQILETSINNNQVYDITEIVSQVRWTTGLDSQPGKLEFSILEDKAVFLRAGDIIEVIADGKKLFKGKVFVRKKKKEKLWQITAYDNLRYLKNEDTIVFGAGTASARFTKICQTQGVPYKVLDNSGYNCAAVVQDKKTYFTMIDEAIRETRTGNYMRYGIRDNYGTLEFFALNRFVTKLVLGDGSLVTGYNYEASIDDAYNAIKVIREDKDTETREVYASTHSGNIAKWGRLQMVENVSDADLNSAQLKQQAADLLAEHNKETKTLSLDCVGSLDIQAGCSFVLRLADLQRDSIGNDNLGLVTSCTHSLESIHAMDLEVEVLS